MFDTDLLVNFLNVIDRGGFTAAAKSTNSTQSTVSAKLARLEEQSGHRLMHRNKRGIVSLTRAGEVIEALARDVVRLQRLTLRNLCEGAISGTVRIGLTDDIASGRNYPSLLARFCEQQPGIGLDVTVASGTQILELFDAGDLDHILLKVGDELPIQAVELWSEPTVWVGKLKSDIRLVTFPPPCRYRERAISILKRRNLPWKVVYVSASLAGVKAAVQAGLGITILPVSLVGSDVPQIPVSQLPIAGSMVFSFVSRADARDAANSAFRDLVMNDIPSPVRAGSETRSRV